MANLKRQAQIEGAIRKTCAMNSGPATLADLTVFDSISSPFPGLNTLDADLSSYPCKLVACAKDSLGWRAFCSRIFSTVSRGGGSFPVRFQTTVLLARAVL